MQEEQPLLEVRGIHKSFSGVEVLHGVDLSVYPGQVVSLLGENGAGKSTLVKILAGDYRPDSGKIKVLQQEFSYLTPNSARALGIRMIFQELNDAPDLSVAENVFLGDWPSKSGLVSWSSMRREAQSVFNDLGTNINVDTKMSDLRVGERQLVEIARSIRAKAKLLILDEPTAALSSSEVDQLFRTIRKLRDSGVGMVYITHRLDEVMAIGGRVKVLRDGVAALDELTSSVDRQSLVSAMIGRDGDSIKRPESSAKTNTPALIVENLSLGKMLSDINFQLNQGEVLALYGKVGSGSAEVAEAIFGLKQKATGTFSVFGKEFIPKSPIVAIKNRIGFLSPDRQREGYFAVRSVAENLVAPSWPSLSSFGVIKRAAEDGKYQKWRKHLGIKSTSNSREPIVSLSGGNQQKILLARWLEKDVDILILVEPTRGVDVGARSDIYKTIQETTQLKGLAILIVTSDYEEVIQIADRALVMLAGSICRQLNGAEITASALTSAAGG